MKERTGRACNGDRRLHEDSVLNYRLDMTVPEASPPCFARTGVRYFAVRSDIYHIDSLEQLEKDQLGSVEVKFKTRSPKAPAIGKAL